MHNTHLDIYQLIHRQDTTKPLVLISTVVAGKTEMLGQKVEVVKLVWCVTYLLMWLCIVPYRLVMNLLNGCPDRSRASASTYSRRDLSPSLLFSRLMPGRDISPRILARFSPPFLAWLLLLPKWS